MKLLPDMPTAVIGTFSNDPDKRRLAWLCCRARLQVAHAAALAPLEEKCRKSLGKGRDWATESDRALIRAMFNIYRGPSVRVQGGR